MTQKLATSEYELHDILKQRWSPRAFSNDAIRPDILWSVLEAARWSPSGGNQQPWRFIVTQKGEQAYENLLGILTGNNLKWAGQAPVLILTVAKLVSDSGRPNRHAYYDLGQAVAHLTVQAGVHGVYVHQMGGYDQDKARELFDVPEGFDTVTVLALGYGGDVTSLPEDLQERELSPRVRKPFAEFVYADKFGTPLQLDVTAPDSTGIR